MSRRPGYRYEAPSGASIRVLGRDLYLVDMPLRWPMMIEINHAKAEICDPIDWGIRTAADYDEIMLMLLAADIAGSA